MSASQSKFEPVNYYSKARTFVLGGFRFENHQLQIESQEDYERFEKLLEGLKPIDRTMVRTVSTAAADSVAKQFMKQRSHSGPMGSTAAALGMDKLREMQTNEDLMRAGIDPYAAKMSPIEGTDNLSQLVATPMQKAEPQKPESSAPVGLAALIRKG